MMRQLEQSPQETSEVFAHVSLDEMCDFAARRLEDPARVQAVAKFRELADRLERGDLRGARVSWREGRAYIEVVEADTLDASDPQVRFYRDYTDGTRTDVPFDANGPHGG